MKQLFTASLSLLFFAMPQQGVAKEQIEKKATFAGGCFWCMEPPFEKLEGVKSVVSGYIGGEEKNPTYKQVSSGKTKHIEAVQISYDSSKITYSDLLQVFWRNVNPTDNEGQFVDRGYQYTTGIFYHDDVQKKEAEISKKAMNESKRFPENIVTPIKEAPIFYIAEEYHQDYYKTNPIRYKYYRYRSGRDSYIERIWGEEKTYSPRSNMESKNTYRKPLMSEIKNKLTDLQYKVTQEEATEPPFKNKYWDHKEAGIYVDIVTGEPLFSSKDKYDSGSGWPSFSKPIDKTFIIEKEDHNLFMSRTEVRSKSGDSHLGHVFEDGPKPTGLRYCVNSAALDFVPVNELEAKGYSEYKKTFE